MNISSCPDKHLAWSRRDDDGDVNVTQSRLVWDDGIWTLTQWQALNFEEEHKIQRLERAHIVDKLHGLNVKYCANDTFWFTSSVFSALMCQKHTWLEALPLTYLNRSTRCKTLMANALSAWIYIKLYLWELYNLGALVSCSCLRYINVKSTSFWRCTEKHREDVDVMSTLGVHRGLCYRLAQMWQISKTLEFRCDVPPLRRVNATSVVFSCTEAMSKSNVPPCVSVRIYSGYLSCEYKRDSRWSAM